VGIPCSRPWWPGSSRRKWPRQLSVFETEAGERMQVDWAVIRRGSKQGESHIGSASSEPARRVP
jgi:hypothetical protein